MIAGILLIAGGVAQLGLGWQLSVDGLMLVGGLWTVCGLVNVTWSKADKRSSAGRAAPPAPTEPADLLNDPLAKAAALRVNRGAPWRGLITLVCAGAAIAVGVIGLGDAVASSLATGTPEAAAFEAWRLLPIIAGGILGLLAVMGLLVAGFSGVERAAVLPATVVILGYKDSGLNNGSSRPMARFVLTVYAEGSPAYEATITSVVPVLAVPHLAVGARFPALAAGPSKPNAVIVDWNKPIDDGSTSGSAAGGVGMTSGAPAGAVASGGMGAVMGGGASGADPATRLRELDALATQNLISPDEYQAQRARILGGI